jgi:hypothetical protein
MKLCQRQLVCVCVFFMATVPVYAQRGNLGVDVGATSDTFGGLATTTAPVVDINGEFAVFQSNPKTGRPAVVAGGEARFPSNANSDHAKEYAVFGGLHWQFGNFTVGVDGQLRKIYLPVAFEDNQFFPRDKMELLELPLVLRYKFLSSRKAFVEAKGAPEFSPRWRSSGATFQLPNPTFDHAYFIQGSVGYNFGRWYAKATYENRFFAFHSNPNNPGNLYNWRTNYVAGGVGVTF